MATVKGHSNMDPMSLPRKKMSFQLLTEQLDTIQGQKNQDTQLMVASQLPEKPRVSELHSQMMKLRVENEKTVLLQKSLQVKVDHFQQQVREKDDTILKLSLLNEDLTHRLSEATQELDKYEGIWSAASKLEEEKDELYQIIRELTDQLDSVNDKLLSKTMLPESNDTLQEELLLKDGSWDTSSPLEEVATQGKEEQTGKEEEQKLDKLKEGQQEKPWEEEWEKHKWEELKPSDLKKELRRKEKEEKLKKKKEKQAKKLMKKKEKEAKKLKKKKEKEEKKLMKRNGGAKAAMMAQGGETKDGGDHMLELVVREEIPPLGWCRKVLAVELSSENKLSFFFPSPLLPSSPHTAAFPGHSDVGLEQQKGTEC